MSVPSPFCFATALAVVFLAGCTETIAQGLNPNVSVQPEYEYLLCVPPRPRLNDPMMYCADENLNDMRENFTALCNVSAGGTVVWLIGGYAMVDRDQFSQQVYGVLVEDSESNYSRFSLFPCGADFLMGQFNGTTFNVTCINMVNEVNFYRSEQHLFFHEGFPDIDIEQRSDVTVVKCNGDDGERSYDVMLKYKKFDDVEVCAVARAEDLSYSAMFGDRDCDDAITDGDDVTILCRNVKDVTVNVTLQVCGGSFCKDAEIRMSESALSCNNVTYDFCPNKSSPTGNTTRFRANFPSCVDGNWGIALASTSGSDILVTDTLDGKPVGEPRPAVYDPLLQCKPDGPTPTPTTTTTPPPTDDGGGQPPILIIIIICIAVLLALLIIIIIIIAVIVYKIKNRKDKDETDGQKDVKIPMSATNSDDNKEEHKYESMH